MRISVCKMQALVLLLFSVIFLASATSTNKKAQTLSRAHFEFSLDLYRQLAASQPQSNLIFSPYSMNLALSMLFLGTSSSSNSSRQLRSILHYDNISYVDVHNTFKGIVNNFAEAYYSAGKMAIANGLYVTSEVAVSPVYDRALREFYHARVQHMDFKNIDPIENKAVINEYVDEVTNGRIPIMLEDAPGMDPVGGNSLVVVNAMALASRWLQPFDPRETFDKGLFFLPNDERLEIPMMSGKFDLPVGYSKELECRVLELPFTQKRISMFVLLPDDSEAGLAQLEANVSTSNIKLLFSTLKNEEVNVRLPKFKARSNIDFKEALARLGLVDLLQKETHDLSLMAPTDELRVSSINHRSLFEVTEEGSAANTAKIASHKKKEERSGGSFNQQFFEVDHPFLFLVWDYYSGMLLLMGRVVNPEAV